MHAAIGNQNEKNQYLNEEIANLDKQITEILALEEEKRRLKARIDVIQKGYSTLGAGVTWRTPWKAKLSVGADNIVTRGKNPFGLPDAREAQGEDEGRVPYVRYQQDL